MQQCFQPRDCSIQVHPGYKSPWRIRGLGADKNQGWFCRVAGAPEVREARARGQKERATGKPTEQNQSIHKTSLSREKRLFHIHQVHQCFLEVWCEDNIPLKSYQMTNPIIFIFLHRIIYFSTTSFTSFHLNPKLFYTDWMKRVNIFYHIYFFVVKAPNLKSAERTTKHAALNKQIQGWSWCRLL